MYPLATDHRDLTDDERRMLQQAAMTFGRPIGIAHTARPSWAIVADVRTGRVTMEIGRP